MTMRYYTILAALAVGTALVASPIFAQPVLPSVSCVEETDEGLYRAYFGYDNQGGQTVTVPLGDDNRYQGGRTDDEPITVFEPGEHSYAFEAVFPHRLTWSIRTSGIKRMVRADQNHPLFNECEPPASSDNEPESPGTLSLLGASPTAFNPVGSLTLTFQVAGAKFSLDAQTHVLVVNGTYTHPAVASEQALDIPVSLDPGRNEVSVYAVDEDGLGLSARYVLWAGSSTQTVYVRDNDGNPVDGAVVRFAIVDDLDVGAEGLSQGGSVTFNNVPPRTLIATAEASGNRFGTAGALGNGELLTITVLSFAPPSHIDNNDFSQGLDGWDVTSGVSDGSVLLVEHIENPGPQPEGRVTSSGTTASLDELDLQLSTGGEGPQRVSRTFTVDPGTRSVTVRYRFITTEVPGGYFGSEFNDYFAVTLRSQAGGGRASEQNSMNGLGLAAFDGSGATAWREVTLPVSEEGDVLQVDVVVANVGDGLYPSQVVVDGVQEATLSVASIELKDNSLFQGALKTCHGGTLLEPLPFFSMGTTQFRDGNTWVWGDLTIAGSPGESVSDVRLEAVFNGTVLSSGELHPSIRSDMLTVVPSSGTLSVSQTSSTPLFVVPGSVYPAADASVTLRIRVDSPDGQTSTRIAGTFPILAHYPGPNRFGSAQRDAEQGGDGWARWSAIRWGLDVAEDPLSSGLLFNDFANMNGGKFPIHCTHRTGEIVDATFDGLPNKDAAAAQHLINMLNSPHGARVERVQTTYAPNGSFWQAISQAGTLTDGRQASDVVGNLPGHPTHMHVTLFPNGRYAGSRLTAQAWTERGPRMATATEIQAQPSQGMATALTIAVSPNPVGDGHLTVNVTGSQQRQVRMLIYDMAGRTVFTLDDVTLASEHSTTTLTLPGLPAGSYALRIVSGEASAMTQFTVVR